ncbi:hypothetical protein [Glaciibacter psychrotolerans]
MPKRQGHSSAYATVPSDSPAKPSNKWWHRRPPVVIVAVVSSYTVFALGALLYVSLFQNNLCLRKSPSCHTILGEEFSPLLIAAGNLAASTWALIPVVLAVLIATLYSRFKLEAAIESWVMRGLFVGVVGTCLAVLSGFIFGTFRWGDPLGGGFIAFFPGMWCSILGNIIYELCKNSWIRVTLASVPGLALATIGFLP